MHKRFCLKKYYLLILLFLFAVAPAQKKFTIVLDAGHGGSDHGANRSYSGIGYVAEKDITLDVTLRVGKMLEKDKNFKVIYTRKIDEYPSLTDRTKLANRSKADLFVSIHVNSSVKTAPYGTETFILGVAQNSTNLEVAKAENDVIMLDAQDRATFASYDPRSPESLIALKIQQSKYRDASLKLAGFIEENFVQKDNRFSRGVKQENFHVLRMNAMPSVLIEMGFVSNEAEARYLASERGKAEISQSIFSAIMSYKKAYDRMGGVKEAAKEPEKPKEQPLKNDFRILLMSTPIKHNYGDPSLKGLKNILAIKENGVYKYYFAETNYASVRDQHLKTARDAGFRNAYAVSFVPNQKLSTGYYTLEVFVGKDKLQNDSYILKNLKNVVRKRENGLFYYTHGEAKSLEDAIKMQNDLEKLGIKNSVIQKVNK